MNKTQIKIFLIALPLVVAIFGCATTTPMPKVSTVASTNVSAVALSQLEIGPWTYPETSAWGMTGSSCEQSAPPQQSPIDFTKFPSFTSWVAKTSLASISQVPNGKFDAHDQNVVFMPFTRTQIIISPGVGGTMAFNYTLLGFHFHQPPEHIVVANQKGMAEMHIKASDQFGDIAVFAFLMEPSSGTDTSLTSLLPTIQNAITNTGPATVNAVNFSPVLYKFSTSYYYSYMGSLTTPPCTTNIRWYVLASPLTASADVLTSLLTALGTAGMPNGGTLPHGNARYPQTLTSPPPTVYMVFP